MLLFVANCTGDFWILSCDVLQVVFLCKFKANISLNFTFEGEKVALISINFLLNFWGVWET